MRVFRKLKVGLAESVRQALRWLAGVWPICEWDNLDAGGRAAILGT